MNVKLKFYFIVGKKKILHIWLWKENFPYMIVKIKFYIYDCKNKILLKAAKSEFYLEFKNF